MDQLANSGEVESWYPSNDFHQDWSSKPPANSSNKLSNRNLSQFNSNTVHLINSLGCFQIRVKIKYRPLDVFSLTSYSRFLNFLINNQPRLINLLNELDDWITVKSKAELASALIGVHLAADLVPQFLCSLILSRVQKQSKVNFN